MKKISKQLLTLAEAIMEGLDEDTKKVLEDATDEDKIAEIGDKVLNSLATFKGKLEAKGRNEVYSGLDAKIFEDGELADIIGKTKFDKIKQSKGVDKHVQLTAAYKEAIKAVKAAKAEAGSDKDAKAYQEQLAKLGEEFEAYKASSTEAIERAKADAKAEADASLLQERLFNVVYAKGNLADPYKNEKFVRKMIVSEIGDKVTEKGLRIDPKTLKVTKEDGTPYFVSGGKAYDIDNLIEETILEDWRKKSEPAPSGNVPAGGNGGNGRYVPIDPIKAAASKSLLSQ